MPKNNKRGLGRGIEALFQESNEQSNNIKDNNNVFDYLPIELIKPNPQQPRKSFNKKSLEQLASSIKDKGILQPIVVREVTGKKNTWQLIAGERRWRAAQIAGLHKIPVHIKNIKDDEASIVALIENIQREDLSVIDEAKGYKRVMEKFSITQEKLSATMHRSRSYIANFIRLLSLPNDVQKYLEDKSLTVGQVRPIIGHERCSELAKVIISKNLNSRQAEELTKEKNKTRNSYKKEPNINIKNLENEIEGHIGLKTSIKDKNGKGKIVFNYKNLDQLDELIRKLTR